MSEKSKSKCAGFLTFIFKPVTIPIRVVINTFINLILDAVIPRSGKQTMLLSTIYGVINDIDVLDPSFSHKKINDQLDLVIDSNSLKFPLMLSHWVWDHHSDYITVVKENLDGIVGDRRRLVTCAERFVELSPNWLLYDHKCAIVTSIIEVLEKSTKVKKINYSAC